MKERSLGMDDTGRSCVSEDGMGRVESFDMGCLVSGVDVSRWLCPCRRRFLLWRLMTSSLEKVNVLVRRLEYRMVRVHVWGVCLDSTPRWTTF